MPPAPEPWLVRWLTRRWYRPGAIAGLLPLAALYAAVTRLRRAMYRCGLWRSRRLAVPVVVIGNLVVGGAGKTPLVIALAQALRDSGWHPGVISRGYGRQKRDAHLLAPGDAVETTGDEALLIAREAAVPVAVAAQRTEAAELLLAGHPEVDILLSDDGLQHYAMARDVELVVVDRGRGFGNGWLLPAGPLREPIDRLRTVDAVLSHGADAEDVRLALPRGPRQWSFAASMAPPRPLAGGAARPWAAWQGLRVHAAAGIGHPQRFFEGLRALGLDVVPHAFPDHHRFRPGDLDFPGTDPVLLTAKDAVKCAGIVSTRYWVVPLETRLPADFLPWLIDLLETARGRENP